MSDKKSNPAPIKDSYKKIILQMFNSENEVKNLENQEETKPIDELTKKWNMNDKILNLFAKNIEKDQELRQTYAKILIGILIVELLALITIFILVGCGVLHYSDTTFNLFITGGIAEIFVLVRVIVKYLFKDNLTNALNIILENNNQVKYYRNNRNKNENEKKKS